MRQVNSTLPITLAITAFFAVTGADIACAQPHASGERSTNILPSKSGKKPAGLTVSPYLWGPDISGTVSLGPIKAPVDLNLSQLASGLKIGGMGHMQYDAGPGFIYAEAIGAKFGDPTFASFASQPVRASAIMLETGAGVHREIQLDENLRVRISPYAGVRYVRLQAEVSGPVIAASGKNDWVDPVLGAVAELPLNNRLALLGKADFAGLSISDNTYRNLALGLQYKASKRLSIFGGYRSTKGQFEASQGLSADLNADGPIIGLDFAPKLGRVSVLRGMARKEKMAHTESAENQEDHDHDSTLELPQNPQR